MGKEIREAKDEDIHRAKALQKEKDLKTLREGNRPLWPASRLPLHLWDAGPFLWQPGSPALRPCKQATCSCAWLVWYSLLQPNLEGERGDNIRIQRLFVSLKEFFFLGGILMSGFGV